MLKSIQNKYLILILILFLLLVLSVLLISDKDISQIIKLAGIYKNGKHLIVFQNNSELRPTGGFIGSFAVVETKNYLIKNIDFETNIYKQDDIFSQNNKFGIKDQALAELLPEGNLALRDSNWEPDFGQSAKNIAWFYEQEYSDSPDTVTALNAEVLRKLIKIVGPIPMVKYDTLIDYDNFYQVLHDKIEREYFEDESNLGIQEPKSILSEMLPIVIARSKKIGNIKQIYRLINEGLKQSDIQLFSFDEKSQETIQDQKWAIKLTDLETDFIHINHANVGSDKTSRDIIEGITCSIFENDNSYDFKLVIAQSIDNQKYDPGNKIFTRIYLPDEAKNINIQQNSVDITDKIDINSQYNQQVLRFYDILPAENQQQIDSIMFELPKDIQTKDLEFIKQSGLYEQSLEINKNNQVYYQGSFKQNVDLTF